MRRRKSRKNIISSICKNREMEEESLDVIVIRKKLWMRSEGKKVRGGRCGMIVREEWW